MKKIYYTFIIAVLLFSATAFAQHVQWLVSTANNYTLNPEMPSQPACGSSNRIYVARMAEYSLDYGVDIFGSMAVESFDPSGNLLWSYPLGDSILVTSITSDATGTLYVAGKYMETMRMGSSDSLVNTGFGFTINLFLFSLDASGNLLWKRNVSIAHPDATEISAVGLDQLGSCWYDLMYFDSASIKRLDANGMDMQSHLITGIRTVSSFSFDPMGNLYITGSTGLVPITIGNFSLFAPEPYMMFVTRVDASGNCNWIKLIHDVTFQSPQIVALDNGDAYMAGTLMDSASFGQVVLQGVEWVYDIFLTKLDSTGNFSWGIEVPHQPTLTGDFDRGKNNFIDVDGAGNVYMCGTIRGIVDWGNGVISDAGSIPSSGISIISFDSSGVARWQISGASAGFISPYSMITTGIDECYFANSVVGPFIMDSDTTNQTGNNFAFVLGKIGFTTGIYQATASNDFIFFPNPVSDLLTVRQTFPGTSNEAIIYDALGDKILSLYVSAVGMNSYQIDVEKLSPGIYFLSMGDVKKKFVVQ